MNRTQMKTRVSISLVLLSIKISLAATVTIGANKEVVLDGKPFFPIMQWVQNASLMASEKQYGFNTFVGQGDNSTALQYCDEAKKQGVYAAHL
jgi:hypothetical protein